MWLPCSPELGVDLQGFGQHLGPHVSHGVPADVQFGQRGVAAQSVEDDGEVCLQPGVSQGQRGQRLQGKHIDIQYYIINYILYTYSSFFINSEILNGNNSKRTGMNHNKKRNVQLMLKCSTY